MAFLRLSRRCQRTSHQTQDNQVQPQPRKLRDRASVACPLEWFVATSDELHLCAPEGPIGLMILADPAERYNLLRGPQSSLTAGMEVER